MKGWRTILFNAVSSIVPILSLTEWHGLIPAEWLPYWLLFVAVANLWLRVITTTPVGKSEA